MNMMNKMTVLAAMAAMELRALKFANREDR